LGAVLGRDFTNTQRVSVTACVKSVLTMGMFGSKS
jgi:hypothetical protein